MASTWNMNQLMSYWLTLVFATWRLLPSVSLIVKAMFRLMVVLEFTAIPGKSITLPVRKSSSAAAPCSLANPKLVIAM